MGSIRIAKSVQQHQRDNGMRLTKAVQEINTCFGLPLTKNTSVSIESDITESTKNKQEHRSGSEIKSKSERKAVVSTRTTEKGFS